MGTLALQFRLFLTVTWIGRTSYLPQCRSVTFIHLDLSVEAAISPEAPPISSIKNQEYCCYEDIKKSS